MDEETKQRCLIQLEKLIEINKSLPKQRTPEWFKLREYKITASNVASCLKKNFTNCNSYIKEYGLEESFEKSENKYCNTYSSETEFILQKKNYIKFEGNKACDWGTKYEPVATMFYERYKNYTVLDFSLIPHPTIDIIAASPDGICKENGTMLEIKCPMNRKIDGKPPIYYFQQMQTQLECCDLEYCDYLECVIKEYASIDKLNEFGDELTIHDKHEHNKTISPFTKGLTVTIGTPTYNKVLYPPHKFLTLEEQIEWAEKKKEKYKVLNVTVMFYKIHEITLTSVKRDRNWFKIILPQLYRTAEKLKTFDPILYQKDINRYNKTGSVIVFNPIEEQFGTKCLLITDEEINMKKRKKK